MKNISYYLLGGFYFLALLNPVLKKYDYGAGFPLVILLAIFLLVIAIIEFEKKRERSTFDTLFLSIFVVFAGLSFIYSTTKNVGLSEVMAFGSVSTIYFLLAHQKLSWIEKFLRVFLFGSFLAVLIGFGLYFTQGEVRMFGPFFNILYHANNWPNAFALFILLSWPLVFAVAQNKIWRFVLLSFLISALLLTYSRGALIAFGGQLILFAIYYFRRINLKTIALSLGVILSVLIIFFGANYIRSTTFEVIDVSEKVSFGNNEGATSKQERIDFWKGAFNLAKEKPVLGWGPFSFRQAYNAKQTTLLANSDHPHNVFLKIAAENGFVAAIAFLLFILSVFVMAFERFRELTNPKRDLLIGLGVSVLGAFAHNLIDYNLNFIVNLSIVFLFLTFMRSISVKRIYKVRSSYIGIVLAILLAIFAVFEGTLLFLNQTGLYKEALTLSLYPRNYYISVADDVIVNDGDKHDAIVALDKQMALNSLDDRAYYLRYALLCSGESYDIDICKNNLSTAISLNPLNDIGYYTDYLKLVARTNLSKQDISIIDSSVNIVWRYFALVEKNVHFTAYTTNVEAAYLFVDYLKPFLSKEDFTNFDIERKEMLEHAFALRKAKEF